MTPGPQEPIRHGDDAVGVLIVDDDDAFVRVAREVVGATPGFDTVGDAASGEEGVSLVPVLAPQLVLMDVRMPGIGGFEAARRIADAGGDEVAVVLMSADPRVLAGAPASRSIGSVRKERLCPSVLRSLWEERTLSLRLGA